MILMIDNFDSFTYNLVQYLGEMGEELVVRRNDDITLDEIAQMKPDQIIVSPGPCSPDEAGISVAAIEHFAGKIPILGVCLGHQAIGQAFGGKVVRAKGVFAQMPEPFDATRYHSLLIERDSMPDCLEISAQTAEGEIMGVRHKTLDVEGVQFHPESILTQDGKRLLRNFVEQHKK